MAKYNIRTIDEIRTMSPDEREALGWIRLQGVSTITAKKLVEPFDARFVGNIHVLHSVSVNLVEPNPTQPVVVVP